MTIQFGSKIAKSLVVLGLVPGIIMLSSCSSANDNSAFNNGAAEPSEVTQTWPAVKGTDLPIDTAPELNGQGESIACPYLDGTWLENTNGQRLTGSGIDDRFEDPACIFWSYEDVPQATVLVRRMTTNADAVAVVDHFAPINSTLKALKPDGWSGGRSKQDDQAGSVYAVWKDNLAVVVLSAQDQSVKPKSIAEEAIKNLGL